MGADRILDLTAATILARCDDVLSSCEIAIPALGVLPNRQRAAGLEAITFGAEETVAAARADPRLPDPSFWSAYFTDSARREIPLRVQQQVIDFCVAGLLRSAWEECEDGDLRAMLAFTAAADRQQREVHRLALDSYHAYYALSGQADRASRLRADDLLAGNGTETGPVLVLVVPAGGGLLPRRREVLRTTRQDATVLLLPGATDRAQADRLVRTLLRSADDPAAGACWAEDAADVPGAYRQAAELARLAAVLPGVRSPATPGDLVLERHLRTDPELAVRLAQVLRPISGFGELLTTVETLLRLDLDRTAAAQALHINRRTLTARLQRIATLTGFDPRTARGLQVLANAVAARGVHELPPEEPG